MKYLFLLFALLIVWAVGSLSVKKPLNEASEVEVSSREREKQPVSVAEDIQAYKTAVKSKSVSIKVIRSEMQKISDSNLSSYEKFKSLSEYLISSDMSLEVFLDELRGVSGSVNKDYFEQLFYLGLRNCSKKNPQEVFEILNDDEVRKSLDLQSFVTDYNENVIVDAIFTGFLESEDTSFISDLKKNELGLWDISETILNLGRKKAADWALKNKDLLTAQEFQKVINFRSDDYKTEAVNKSEQNINYALSWAKGFEKGSIESAYALSNVAVQQGQFQDKHNQETEWLTDFKAGFTRDRVTLGYALGTSRFYKDEELEKSLKDMFRKNDFKVEEAKALIQKSNLPEDVKSRLLGMQ